jgi:hypothetical protein
VATVPLPICQAQTVSEVVLSQSSSTNNIDFQEDSYLVGVQRDTNYDMYENEFLELTIDEEAAFLVSLDVEQVKSSSKSSKMDKVVTEVCNTCTVKFDSACSRCMSGIPERLIDTTKPLSTIAVRGFNGTVSTVDTVGVNDDGKREYFIQSMPADLCLLSANEYAKDGAAILMEDDGVVLRLSNEEKERFREYISQFQKIKELVVRNRTYEVAHSSNDEVAMNNTATRYFNSKVNVSNSEERIMATLLTGLSFRDIYYLVKHNCAKGLPRDITVQSLNSFQHKYGSTPDVLQLAVPNLAGNTKGYMAPIEKVTEVGQRVEADYMQFDFNDTIVDTKTQQKKTIKLTSHGGATGAYLSVDVYSGMLHGRLIVSVGESVKRVKETIETYTRDGHAVKLFAADQGVLIQGKFSVATPEVQEYVRKICKIECSEPYQHNYGTSHIERSVRSVSELVRFAILYVLNNPNLKFMGFTKVQLLRLWGELFVWALTVINLKPCANCPSKTKYEVYHNKQPDLREIRLLPIFAVLYVLRRKGHNDLDSNRDFWQRGFYIGPSATVLGAVRVAVLTKTKLVQIITSSEIKAVSDGGDLNSYSHIATAVNRIIQEDNVLETRDSSDIILAQDNDDPLDNLENPLKSSKAVVVPAFDQATTVTSNAMDNSIAVNSAKPIAVLATAALTTNAINNAKSTAVLPIADNSATTAAGGRSDGFEIVSEILGHRGSIKKKTKMRFKVRWENYDSSHDSWLSLKDLRDNAVLHVYLQNHGMAKLIPPLYRPNYVQEKVAVIDSTPAVMSIYQDREVTSILSGSGSKQQQPTSTGKQKNKSIEAMSVCELLHHVNQHIHDVDDKEIETCCFVDWSNHDDDTYYYSFVYNAYMVIDNRSYVIDEAESIEEEICLRAVTENVPRNFTAALHDPVWGDAARKELHTVTEATGAMIKVDAEIAKDHIRQGADVLRMISVYEEKVKDGELVHKVRLVADGRFHKNHGPTYSPTPSREELLILLHICAARGWDYWHVDEVRAFLNAPKQAVKKVFAKISGDGGYWEIVKAVYGLKDAARDYHDAVEDRLLNKLQFKKLELCTSVYTKRISPESVVLVYDYVDDFIFTGADSSAVVSEINEFRKCATTTDPILNAGLLLGMEVTRQKDINLIHVTMQRRIAELCEKYPQAVKTKRNVPMPRTGYALRPQDMESLAPSKRRLLSKVEIESYMSIVGSLLWIQGVRLDIIFAVLYLTWNTKSPLQHHLDMAYYLIGYLSTTSDMPLVLGGDNAIQVITYIDASHGTGPNSRSITGSLTKLNPQSGAIAAKASAQSTVKLSSFESELDGVTTGLKKSAHIKNALTEMGVEHNPVAQLKNDNKAMIEFVKGEGMAKGVRHMELRMWYTRNEYAKGKVDFNYMNGAEIPSDHLTKLGTVEEHRKFARSIQGLMLLPNDYFPDPAQLKEEVN